MEGYVTAGVGPPFDTNAWSRGWHAFRRWQGARPFWGGLLLMLAGIELFASANLSLGGLQVHFGVEGFLSYLLPVLLLLTGIFVWVTPNQRFFYAIIGVLTAVYSIIGLNLGGWLCGMVLGIVGGALAFAWTPVPPAATDNDVPPGADDDDDRKTEELHFDQPDGAPFLDESGADWATDDSDEPRRGARRDKGTGPPRDSLCVWGAGLLLAAAFVGASLRSPAAAAITAPCPNQPSAEASVPSAEPSVTPAALAEPSGTPLPSPTPEPSSTPQPSQTPSPSPTVSDRGMCTDSGAASVSPSPTQAVAEKTIEPSPGQPLVVATPDRLTASTTTLEGFTFDGVTDLPTATGSQRVLKFSLTKATNTDFTLVVDDAGRAWSTTAGTLVLTDHVHLYATRFSGKLDGVPFTFTPDAPPTTTTSSAVFTDVSIDLLFADCDTVEAPGMAESWIT